MRVRVTMRVTVTVRDRRRDRESLLTDRSGQRVEVFQHSAFAYESPRILVSIHQLHVPREVVHHTGRTEGRRPRRERRERVGEGRGGEGGRGEGIATCPQLLHNRRLMRS
jgi:hypothetical protein